jgi:hypothetical protein
VIRLATCGLESGPGSEYSCMDIGGNERLWTASRALRQMQSRRGPALASASTTSLTRSPTSALGGRNVLGRGHRAPNTRDPAIWDVSRAPLTRLPLRGLLVVTDRQHVVSDCPSRSARPAMRRRSDPGPAPNMCPRWCARCAAPNATVAQAGRWRVTRAPPVRSLAPSTLLAHLVPRPLRSTRPLQPALLPRRSRLIWSVSAPGLRRLAPQRGTAALNCSSTLG